MQIELVFLLDSLRNETKRNETSIVLNNSEILFIHYCLSITNHHFIIYLQRHKI